MFSVFLVLTMTLNWSDQTYRSQVTNLELVSVLSGPVNVYSSFMWQGAYVYNR